MPEYLAPGVYVEEVSFRSKSIEGVSTTVTGFIGPTRYGPFDMVPSLLTSLADFEATYGDGQQLEFNDAGEMDNFVWHAVRSFFEEGGQQLYVMRTFRASAPSARLTAEKLNPSGQASQTLGSGGTGARPLLVQARFPGSAGNIRARFTLRIGQNVLGGDTTGRTTGALQPYDIVWIDRLASPPGSAHGKVYQANLAIDPVSQAEKWTFVNGNETLPLGSLAPNLDPAFSDSIRVVTLTATVFPTDAAALPQVWSNLPLDPDHTTGGQADSVMEVFSATPANRAAALGLPLIIASANPDSASADIRNGVDLVQAIENAAVQLTGSGLLATLDNPLATDLDRSLTFSLAGGNDGDRPTAKEYEGRALDTEDVKTGLKAFEDIDELSIVAAPGSTFGYEDAYRFDAATISNLLIAHAELMRYRIAVLDAGDGQNISQVRAMRGKMDSEYAAFYYPWITILDPITQRELNIPPSGSVAGIYCRNDINRGVYKAPGNEVVNLAIGFEKSINKAQQDVLNPEGINCFRFFEDRGFRLWGVRTISSDPEWKYVSLRRYFAYLEHSIDKGTQWAVFEPNGPLLWANIRRTVEDFLLNEWQSGALLGDKPQQAYFVRCDRSTMTQNDLDNGRLVCLVGVAPVRPAEYVIFRIGQWTADAKS
jgi:phage tail sheath protein FI